VEHLAERKRIVEAEMVAGWRPLFMREGAVVDCASAVQDGKETRGQGDKGKSVGNALGGVPAPLGHRSHHAPRDVSPHPHPPHAQAGTRGRGEGAAVDAANKEPYIKCDPPSPQPSPEGRGRTKVECGPRWSTKYWYPLNSEGQLALDDEGKLREPPRVTLKLEGVECTCRNTIKCVCLRNATGPRGRPVPYGCVDAIESLGQSDCDAEAGYDRIELGLALERVRDPLSFLRRARRLLKPGGELTASVANVRRESVVRALIEGRWEAAGEGEREGRSEGEPAPLRFFTMREIGKLLYRAGFGSVEILPAGHKDERDGLGRPSSGNAQPFVNGLPDNEAQEFNVERYDVTAVAETQGDYGLTSIVIVTHNQIACTRACLESIRFLTDEPYELIVVDNGSTDGTVEYLRSCSDVKLIENPDNRGFPAAVNQGIRVSQGAQVLLLNNDVLVTTGWLRRMLEAMEEKAEGKGQKAEENRKSEVQSPKSAEKGSGSYTQRAPGVQGSGGTDADERAYSSPHAPREGNHHAERDAYGNVGLVGPLTNCASGYQEIPISYADLACLDGFAWKHAKQHAGQKREVDRLIGFCLLIRREVIEQVGLLDERFGIGNYEDDDFCRRARDAGWQLVVAQDAFIHHFGHRTFDAAGIDLKALLERNKAIYDEKWQEDSPKSEVQSPKLEGWRTESAANRPHPSPLPKGEGVSAPLPASHPSSLIPLSLCMIVRNNARTIRAALESARPWVDEMIVVDTGSTDATPDICRELGAQVYHFPWPDSFAIARNESLKYAKGEWIFWMDSDDVIDAANGRKLRQLVAELVRVPETERARDGKRVETDARCSTPSPQPSPRGRGSVAPGNPKYKIENPKSTVLGYVMQVHCPGSGADGIHDVTVVDHLKLFRNRPDLRFEGRIHEQVLEAVNRAGGEIVFTDIFVAHAGADHSREGRKRKLLRDMKLLRLDRRERPNHTFVHFNLGMTYADVGKHRKAIHSLRKSLQLAQPHESHVRKVYALLAASHRELGQKTEARQACAEGLQLYPKDPELLFRNALLMHEDGRLRAAELSYLAALANDDALHFSSIDRGIVGYKARHNLAVVYTDMGAWHKAEAQWRQVIAEVPGYRDGWCGLIENLILQRKFGDAGLEEALRELVRLQPEDAAAHHNLGTLLMHSGRFSEAAEAFRKSLRERPDSALTQLSLGYALSNAGRRAEARAAFEKSVRLAAEPRLTAEAQRQLAALAA
jgi:GT2 family glycosyltransferase/tetratricopeptide (TPR) repeat protein